MDACDRTREYLQSQGLLCYKPGIARGKCRAPYVVVRGGGSYAQNMSGSVGIGYRIVTLYCFVPREDGDLAALVKKTKAAMQGLKTQLMPTGNEGPEMIEDDYDARSQTLEYRVLRAEL
ncbi:MAG: hypothetical protein Q4F18_15550 [Clostridia bacterium]|nr:hypothetical protein [Clostridia bacterium]